MKNKKYTVTIERIDLIDTDKELENSFEWGDWLYTDETFWTHKDYFEDFIPEKYKQYLSIESVQDQFEFDVKRCVADAYVQGMETKLIQIVNRFIKSTIENGIEELNNNLKYTIDFEGSTILAFADTIKLTFDRKNAIEFLRSQDIYDRINNTFEEVVLEFILDNKKSFSYDYLEPAWSWDNVQKLQIIFNDYNEVVPAIEKLLQKKKDLIKRMIKSGVPLIYRQAKIDDLLQ
ncbi:MAG: hypothetical protein PHG08_00895 [Bacilli bacterium]|nr:hypothetical protein [Bacilli bacterium]